jgi:hypothetical protein
MLIGRPLMSCSDVQTWLDQLSSLGGLTVTDKGSSEIGTTGGPSGDGDDVELSGGEMAGIGTAYWLHVYSELGAHPCLLTV